MKINRVNISKDERIVYSPDKDSVCSKRGTKYEKKMKINRVNIRNCY